MSASNLLKIGLGAAALVASAAFFFVKDEQKQKPKPKPKEPVENEPANNVGDECDKLNAGLYRICQVWISFSYS